MMSDNPQRRDELANIIRNFNIESFYASVSKTFGALARPGINFTPEQMTKIKEAIEHGNVLDAQNTILDGLENIDDGDH